MLEGMTEQPTPVPSPDALDRLAALVSALADFGIIVVLVEAVSVLRRRRSPMRAAARLALVGFSVLGLNTLLKRTVGRQRPEGAEAPPAMARIPTSSSFPSGHTMAATTAAVAIPEGPLGIAVGLAGAGAVGWSRLRLGAHHRGDVAGGLAIGAAVGTLLRIVLRSLERS
jgi:undecaprenyl-diphosphatase